MNDFFDKFKQKPSFDNHAESISKHLEQKYKSGEVTVFHEIFSPDFHLDVYVVDSEQHNFKILLQISGKVLKTRTILTRYFFTRSTY